LLAIESTAPLRPGGNTQFLRIERLPNELMALNLDRVVEPPELSR
jgi:hypothetical protein